MGRAFTRAQLAGMRQEDAAAQVDDINAWAAAGAVDGQAPVSLRRPDGHRFTAAEISAMPVAEFEANKDLIDGWLAAGGAAQDREQW